jgi:hypothetical protein
MFTEMGMAAFAERAQHELLATGARRHASGLWKRETT